MKTDDFELNYGSVYFGNDKNYACKTIGNIKEVGSQFTATDDMIVSVQDNNISILKESDLKSAISLILSLKMAEIALIKKVTEEFPILLLDDVMSELDNHRQLKLLESIDEEV